MKRILILALILISFGVNAQTVKYNNNKITFNKDVITAKYVAQDSCKIVNRVIVGTKGNYTDLKTACEVAYTAPTEILLDGGTFDVANTITINNANVISIRGISSTGTVIRSATGLTNKPMFTITANVYFDKLTILGTNLASWGTQSTENIFNVSGASAYIDVQNCVITGGYNQFNFTGISTSSFIFNSIFNSAINASILINTTGANYLDCETNTFSNCKRAIHLLQSSDGEFNLIQNLFDNPSNETAIVYVPTTGSDNYILHSHSSIYNNRWNNVGSFVSGFDFSLASGRDANIYIQNNIGYENKNPHAKINVLNNASTTTVTTAGTFYKAVFTNTSTYKVKFTVADNKLTYQPVNKRDCIVWISANVISSSNARNIDIAIVKNGNTALGLFGQITARCETASQPYAISTTAYLQDVSPADYFEIWLTASNNGNNVVLQDLSLFIDSK